MCSRVARRSAICIVVNEGVAVNNNICCLTRNAGTIKGIANYCNRNGIDCSTQIYTPGGHPSRNRIESTVRYNMAAAAAGGTGKLKACAAIIYGQSVKYLPGAGIHRRNRYSVVNSILNREILEGYIVLVVVNCNTGQVGILSVNYHARFRAYYR